MDIRRAAEGYPSGELRLREEDAEARPLRACRAYTARRLVCCGDEVSVYSEPQQTKRRARHDFGLLGLAALGSVGLGLRLGYQARRRMRSTRGAPWLSLMSSSSV